MVSFISTSSQRKPGSSGSLRRRIPVFTGMTALGVFLCLCGARANTLFFHGLNDVPVMPGLAEQPEGEFVFDKPEGRIVEAAAAGDATVADIYHFYDAALVQLGWRAAGGHVFIRNGERLRLTVAEASGQRVLKVAVTPSGAAENGGK